MKPQPPKLQPPKLQPQKLAGGMSPIFKVLAGCGCLSLGAFFAFSLVAGLGLFWGYSKVADFSQPYQKKGYRRVSSQLVTERDPVEGPVVYTAQVVKLRDGSKGDVAFACQTVEVNGVVEGDIDFFGQVLTIHPDAVVKGDVRVEGAQLVVIRGIVEGEVTGNWSVIRHEQAEKAIAIEVVEDRAAEEVSVEKIETDSSAPSPAHDE